ncbi:hypothetical protein QBC44DRAFT_309118 [Cladorrhinum sp. PSN332]|nr:hypothetical protein QBC44DRAFT_309118 [Cladorrhinum sp. PSN332]
MEVLPVTTTPSTTGVGEELDRVVVELSATTPTSEGNVTPDSIYHHLSSAMRNNTDSQGSKASRGRSTLAMTLWATAAPGGADARIKTGGDVLNGSFGSAKRRQVDPTSYQQVERSTIFDWDQTRADVFQDGDVFYLDKTQYRALALKFVENAIEAGHQDWEILDAARANVTAAIELVQGWKEFAHAPQGNPDQKLSSEVAVVHGLFVEIAEEVEHRMALAAERVALQDAGYDIIDSYAAEPRMPTLDVDADWEVVGPVPLIARIDRSAETAERHDADPNTATADRTTIPTMTDHENRDTSEATARKKSVIGKAWRWATGGSKSRNM